MPSKKSKLIKTHIQRKHGDIIDRVHAGLLLQGLSFHQFCEEHDINRNNATRALLGTWQGKKAKILRSKLIQASHAHRLPHIAPIPEQAKRNSHE